MIKRIKIGNILMIIIFLSISILSLYVALVCLYVALIGCKNVYKYFVFTKTIAKVTDIKVREVIREDYDGNEHKVKEKYYLLEYYDKNEKRYSVWKNFFIRKIKIGDEVLIRYDPNNPKEVLDIYSIFILFFVILGILIMFMFSLGIILLPYIFFENLIKGRNS